MDESNACQIEDVIQVFLGFFVDPLLPKSIRETPNQDKQERVAKQVLAVVLLYNHFFRKRHPRLNYLDFDSFCTLALVLKPNLKLYMNIQRTDDTKSDDLEKQLSTTEKAIKDACDISRSLGASINVPNAKGWPVRKVAILLINPKKENCILIDNSITEGVKSLIEKDVNEPLCSPADSIEAKQLSKRRRASNKHSQDDLEGDECHLRKIAFKAVEEATKDGIKQSDLTIMEAHNVYSLSKVKTATRFYIMQCAQATKARWIPIKDIFDSLQGPLLQKTFSGWMHTSVVEYFHLLPYARIIAQWFSSNVFPIEEPESVQEVGDVNGFEMTEEPLGPEVRDNRNIDLIDGGIVEASRNSSCAGSEKLNEKNEHCTNDFSDDIDGPWNMDVDNHSMVQIEKSSTSKIVAGRVQHDSQLKKINSHAVHNLNGTTGKPKFEVVNSPVQNLNHLMDVDNYSMVQIEKSSTSKNVAGRVQHDSQLKKINSHAIHNLNGTTDKPKFEVVNSPVQNLNHLKDQNGTNRKAASRNMSGQNGIPAGNHAPVIRESNSKYSAKLHKAIASKEHVLSETALNVVLRKRDKLALQLRDIVDEIAQQDKKIQTILNGGEDALELKLDLIIEGCQGSPSKDYEDTCSFQSKKRNRSSEEACCKQNPCQELDGICKDKNWVLPTYHVFPSDGGYQARVSVGGTNLELSSVGDACSEPHEARGSAASKMLTKLLDHV